MSAHQRDRQGPAGSFVHEDGLEWYRIDAVDLLDPFLMTLVTPTDVWLFVSSSGALTAGRRSALHALFPYENDDRLHRSGGTVGPLTVIRAGGEVWEPFASHVPLEVVERSIAKTAAGDHIRFEERHPELGLTFRATWSASGRHGVVRTCEISSDDGIAATSIDILDGLLDVIPAGVDPDTLRSTSTLVDGYGRSEFDPVSGMALFTLEAQVSDRPVPAESLTANVVWGRGLDDTVTLSDAGIRAFRSGSDIEAEHVVKGRKGSYVASATRTVGPGDPFRWTLVADASLGHREVASLRRFLSESSDPAKDVQLQVDQGHRDLERVVGMADGAQLTADRRATVHHFANVVFNLMRGGVFLDDHRISVSAAGLFVGERNRGLTERFREATAALDEVVTIEALREAVAGDGDLERLVAEYLPLSFSRRHGDPSRPWNRFEINLWTEDGRAVTGFEGNWRDIFQNWDALLHSFPAYLPSVISSFLSASTVDGFNPYRISESGIDWEMEEDGAWDNFGYWGDHQIAYLHRLLDAADRFRPGWLESGLGDRWLAYGDVPYRLVPYPQIVADPRHTLLFDHDRQAIIEERVAAIGADGRLVASSDGQGVHLASLAEKLLVPALSKLSNLVVGGGIWMNTQRPEWNDANNALVGNGVSMVTLLYLRDYLRFVDGVMERSIAEVVPIASRVRSWLEGLRRVFARHAASIGGDVDPATRRSLLDGLGEVFSTYRETAYDHGPGGPVDVPVAELRSFIAATLPFLDASVRSAHRTDGLVESYNVLHLADAEATLEPLGEMLEGQVAFLAAGGASVEEAIALVDTLFESELYRSDQQSFLLYPYRQLPSFMDKNVVPDDLLGSAARSLLDGGSGALARDADGVVRFHPSVASAAHLEPLLDAHEDALGALPGGGRQEILDLHEAVFRHAAFTGRSGTMYRYEGLGSIYWHMVSKLLFAIQEIIVRAVDEGADSGSVAALAERYHRVRAGLGFMKDVVDQGTFPTDPHSHTPAHTGAQQPGMTGQVKEGVLIRWGELGVRVTDGRLRFQPIVLSAEEFLPEARSWDLADVSVELEPGTLGFTYCGVPVVYQLVDGEGWSRVKWSDGRAVEGEGTLDRDTSQAVFAREGLVTRIDVGVPRSQLA
jgi:hypothetical protein